MSTATAALLAEGVPPMVAAGLAEDAGFAMVGEAPKDGLPLVLLLSEIDPDRLTRALRPPTAACLEFAFGKAGIGPGLGPTLRAGGLYLSLSTTTAYGLGPAHAFAAAVAARTDMSHAACQGLELALHEATVNAMLHGNLEMPPSPRETIEAMTEFYRSVEAHLADSRRAARRVEIAARWSRAAIEVSVRDEGRGFIHTAQPAAADPTAKSGRGLTLIRHLAAGVEFSDGGRRIAMSFAR